MSGGFGSGCRRLLLCAFCAIAGQSHATTLTVTNVNDSGPGSLREAITSANNAGGDDVIVFAVNLAGTIQLASPLPDLSTNIDLQGPGPDVVTVRRATGGAYRIFTVSNGGFPGPVVRISGLAIANADVLFNTFPNNVGAGIYHDYGSLIVENCVFAGNIANWGGRHLQRGDGIDRHELHLQREPGAEGWRHRHAMSK